MTLDRRQFLDAVGAGAVGSGLLRPGGAQANGRDPFGADGPLELSTVQNPAARLRPVPFHRAAH